MQNQIISMDVTLDALRRAQFAMMDVLRRTQGNALGEFGLSPTECPYESSPPDSTGVSATMLSMRPHRHFYHYLLSRRPSNGHTSGISPPLRARSAIACENAYTSFYSNGCRPRVIVETTDSLNTPKLSPNALSKSQTKPKVQSRSSSVIHSVARSPPYIVHWHQKACAALCFSAHHFVSKRTQTISGMHSSP